jgi:hypothetical protein
MLLSRGLLDSGALLTLVARIDIDELVELKSKPLTEATSVVIDMSKSDVERRWWSFIKQSH